MKLHELQPAEGSRKPRTRVGRGIAAGKGKTAGRGTKGQKARAGGSIQPWFEGGQTPLQIRIPKLRGFKNRFKTEYEVVNVGELSALAEFGALESGEPGAEAASPSSGSGGGAAVTITQDILRAVGLVRTLDRPLKILGGGDVSQRLFVVADAFSKSAVSKIEAAGGTAQVLEIPTSPLAAIGVVPAPAATEEPSGERRRTPRQPRPSGETSVEAEAATEESPASAATEEAEAADVGTEGEAPVTDPDASGPETL